MKETISNLFYLKRAKPNKNGLVPIFHRVTVNGKRIKDNSTGKYIDPEKWSDGCRVKGTSEEARLINDHLDKLKNEVLEAERHLYMKKEKVKPENMQSKLKGNDDRVRTIIPIFKEHNTKMWALVPDEFAQGTAERYDTSLKHTESFMMWKYKVADIDIDNIDYYFITEFEFYLKSQKNCCHNTAVKYVKNFQKIINICLKNEWIIKDPFLKYESKVKEVERDYLSLIELRSIYRKKFVSERLRLVRDIFVFSCYTGLAYIDVKQLASENISLGIDGVNWIFKNRQKTDGPSNIPMLPIAQEIINRYAQHPKCLNENRMLPILSNQKMNSYLKEVADVCGITKELTFHAARHTFATTVTLSNGVPIESVSKMLGHKNLKSTQIYARVLDIKVSADMQALRTKLHDIMNSEDGRVLLSYTA